ncbi:hypothetical protein BH23BAC1_BH23BAC1_39050 [soil metagenome]
MDLENKNIPGNTENISPGEKKSSQEKYKVEIPLEKSIIGRLIRALREIRNYSQTTLGRLIGVKRAQISKFETGNGNLTLSSLLKLFTALRARVSFKVEVDKKKDAKILEEVKTDNSEKNDLDKLTEKI